MARTWFCELCTFKNIGEGVCVVCEKGQPPPLAGQWKCTFCTLLNTSNNKSCIVCNHPRKKNHEVVSQKPEVGSQISSYKHKQRKRESSGARKISSIPKAPPQLKPKAIEFHPKVDKNFAQRLPNYNQNYPQSMDTYEEPKRYNEKRKSYNQKGMCSNNMDIDTDQKSLQINRKKVKSIHIDLEMSLVEDIELPPEKDNLITIEPHRPKAAKGFRAPPPYSSASSSPQRRRSFSEEEFKVDILRPNSSIDSLYKEPAPRQYQQRSGIGMMRNNNMGAGHFWEDDMKGQPIFGGPSALSKATAEPIPQKNSEDLGTEALIRKLLQEEMCELCVRKQGMEVGECRHKVCKSCGKQKIKSGLVSKKWASQAVTCPVKGCKIILPQNVFRYFDLCASTIKELEIMQQKFNMSQTKGLVQCPSKDCGYRFVGEPGKVVKDKIEVGRNGKPLNEVTLKHKAKHRFRCPQCKINFCGECSASPYHLGDTCQTFRNWKVSKKCRFCEATIDQSKVTHKPDLRYPGWDNVCHLQECQDRRKQSCGKIHPCGHPCIGIRGETKCPPCFHPDCVPKGGKTHDDYCTICYVEGWSAAPCVQLECKHVFHYHCLMQKLKTRWPAARVVFKYLRCGECNRPIKNEMLKRTLYSHEKLKKKVERLALDQLKREGFDEDKRLHDKNDKYYNNKALFAMDRLAYYICYKCKKPYYGGMRKCDAQDIDKWNEKHLVCGGCRMGSNKKSCKIHGTEFIVWKCKFCCSRGSWFCWGNTHFCDKCHKRQEGGDYLNRKPMSAHPKCPGIESGNPMDCPLKVKHPPNGTNFCLGCNVCLIS